MPKNFCEISITVPYGEIAAKAWGHSNSDKVIIAIHGWNENAGSFDKLIPLFPDSVYVIAIDLPGHGFSSHLPRGCLYSDLVFLVALKRIVDSLKLTKIILLAHSMGATLGLYFACIYPEIIVKIIAFDMIKPLCFAGEELTKINRTALELILQLDQPNNKNFETVYDHQSILESFMTERGKISTESAQCLLIRGTKLSTDRKGYCLTRDNSLDAVVFQLMSNEAIFYYLDNLKCDLLIINSIKVSNPIHSDLVCQQKQKYLKYYESKCNYFKYIEIESDWENHVHLCEPKKIIANVLEFL